MAPQVILLDHVQQRLVGFDSPGVTNLYGVIYDKKILIVGFGQEVPSSLKEFSSSTKTSKPNSSESELSDGRSGDEISPVSSRLKANSDHQIIFPTGIDHVGVLIIKSNSFTQTEGEIKSIISDVYVTDSPIVLEKDCEEDNLNIYFLKDEKKNPINLTTMSSSDFQSSFCYIRLLGNFSTTLPAQGTGTNSKISGLKEFSERISEDIIFRIEKPDAYISKDLSFSNQQSNFGSVYEASVREKDYRIGFEVLNIDVLFPSTINAEHQKNTSAPYLIDYSCSDVTEPPKKVSNDKEKKFSTVELPLDGLILAYRNRSIQDIYSLLIDAAERSLYLAEFYAGLSCDGGLGSIRVNHFFPTDLGHPISIVYFPDQNDTELVDFRRKIHKCFYLPEERPLFRKGLALDFRNSIEPPVPLFDVHLGAKLSGIKSTTNRHSATLNGSYQYYHYNLDIKDDGWGCAYRSLQTIASWFLLQGFTSKSVPTIKQIQQELVRIGDKNSKFVGSSTWIGSTEVMFVLQSYLTIVESIIVNVPNGSEMYTMAPVLLEHFRNHGTPVMIGGGVLAHTIIGVDFDEDMTDVRFLILDPHYTGVDHLPTILKKGAVGWKGLDFWDKKSFHNLCFPQRPICI